MVRLYKLGCDMSDKASGAKGQLTHVQTDGDNTYYLFQPKGLNPETGLPVDSKWICAWRVVDGLKVQVELPIELVGTAVRDRASGFGGIVTFVELHINGCLHALIQAKGEVKKTGAMVVESNFDIRRLTGARVPTFGSDGAMVRHMKKKPSPAPSTAYVPTS